MKHLHMTLLLLLLLSTMSIKAKTYDCLINGIYYNLNTSKREAEVTSSGSDSYMGAVSIPKSITYNGIEYRVTSIGEFAFNDCIGLTSVTIPNSVTLIADAAFQNCI